MLVLSRKKGESIVVGDDIEIRILEVHGNQVKIGVQAPTHHKVHRKEVYLAIQENRANLPRV
jgi:carbon storage regulator